MTRVVTCILLCTAALLSGCRLDGAVEVAVEGGGGGTVAFTVAVDRELARAAADAGVDPLANLEQTVTGLDAWEVTRRDDDGASAVTLTTRFADGAELRRVTGELSRALAGPELAPLEPLRLTVTDDTVTLDGAAGLAVTRQVRELGLTRVEAEERLAGAVGLRVVARMPGAVVRTDADERPDERTAVWIVEAGQRRTLTVEAQRPWSLARVVGRLGGPYAVAAMLAGVLALAAAGVLLRRRRVPAAGAGDPAGGAAAAGDGDADSRAPAGDGAASGTSTAGGAVEEA